MDSSLYMELKNCTLDFNSTTLDFLHVLSEHTGALGLDPQAEIKYLRVGIRELDLTFSANPRLLIRLTSI